MEVMSIPTNLLWDSVPGAAVMSAISVAYVVTDKRPFGWLRVASSGHGALASILLFGAIFLWSTGHSSGAYAIPYVGMFIFPLASVVLSIACYSGNKLVHLLHIPNIMCMLWAIFIGGMAITNDWL